MNSYYVTFSYIIGCVSFVRDWKLENHKQFWFVDIVLLIYDVMWTHTNVSEKHVSIFTAPELLRRVGMIYLRVHIESQSRRITSTPSPPSEPHVSYIGFDKV
jgi:hypothetical protein